SALDSACTQPKTVAHSPMIRGLLPEPWLLQLARALPAAVRGPLLFCAFLRLASICFAELISVPPRTIATARDSWSRRMSLPRLRAPGQQQAQPSALPKPPAAMLPSEPLLQRPSFSSERASSAGHPPAGPGELGWARAAAGHSRHQPPDAPIRSAAGSRSA